MMHGVETMVRTEVETMLLHGLPAEELQVGVGDMARVAWLLSLDYCLGRRAPGRLSLRACGPGCGIDKRDSRNTGLGTQGMSWIPGSTDLRVGCRGWLGSWRREGVRAAGGRPLSDG
jgi:hypothetical protein